MAGAAAVASVSDPHDLERFVTAQEGVYESAVAELRAGRKTGHWMWFVFPQIAGLGHERDVAALRDRLAGRGAAPTSTIPCSAPRLAECAAHPHRAARRTTPRTSSAAIDAIKLRSSMTLFARAIGG